MAATPSLAARGTQTVLKSLGGEVVAIPFTFTTSADSGSTATLVYDYNGNLGLDVTESSPDLYVFDVGGYKQFLSCPLHHNLDSSIQVSVAYSAANGTVTLSCATNALASATVTGCIFVLK